jgi:hypothetical protein
VEKLKRCATDLGLGTYVTQAQNIIDKVCQAEANGAAQSSLSVAAVVAAAFWF